MAKKREEKTNAMRLLEKSGISFTEHEYEHSDRDPFTNGVDVAEELGLDTERVFKTLVARGNSGRIFVFVIPVAETVDLKKAAKAVGEKSVELTAVKELFPLTGYIRGGCSPIGMKKQYPTVIDETALLFDTIYISGGKIGYQIEINPADLLSFLSAKSEDITA